MTQYRFREHPHMGIGKLFIHKSKALLISNRTQGVVCVCVSILLKSPIIELRMYRMIKALAYYLTNRLHGMVTLLPLLGKFLACCGHCTKQETGLPTQHIHSLLAKFYLENKYKYKKA